MCRTVNGKFKPESMMEKTSLTRILDTLAFFTVVFFYTYDFP